VTDLLFPIRSFPDPVEALLTKAVQEPIMLYVDGVCLLIKDFTRAQAFQHS